MSALHAGIVENTIQGGKFLNDLSRGFADGIEIGDIQDEMPHAGICRAEGPEPIFAASADYDLIPQFMECFGKPFPDARSAARDENCVGMHFHEIIPYNSWRSLCVNADRFGR